MASGGTGLQVAGITEKAKGIASVKSARPVSQPGVKARLEEVSEIAGASQRAARLRVSELNQRHPASKTGTLPTELRPEIDGRGRESVFIASPKIGCAGRNYTCDLLLMRQPSCYCSTARLFSSFKCSNSMTIGTDQFTLFDFHHY